jgi:hypothetical protein
MEKEDPRINQPTPHRSPLNKPKLRRRLLRQPIPHRQPSSQHLAPRRAHLSISPPINQIIQPNGLKEISLPSFIGHVRAFARDGAAGTGAVPCCFVGEVIGKVEKLAAGEEGGLHARFEPEDFWDFHL